MRRTREIFVDFDGTICPNKNSTEEYPAPSEHCLRTLKRLKKTCRIVIYSVRSNLDATIKPGGHTEMVAYLKKHKIPYDDIEDTKVHFTSLIDDKGLGIPLDSDGNVRWYDVETLLEKKEYIPRS